MIKKKMQKFKYFSFHKKKGIDKVRHRMELARMELASNASQATLVNFCLNRRNISSKIDENPNPYPHIFDPKITLKFRKKCSNLKEKVQIFKKKLKIGKTVQ